MPNSQIKNHATFSFQALKENVVAARLLAASFSTQVNFTLSEIEEIKVAVSEGVSNAIIHGYGNNPHDIITMEFIVDAESLTIIIKDVGRGIEDVTKAMEATFSTVADRMGLGFVFMQSFTDEFQVDSVLGKGTTLIMKKYAPNRHE